MKWLAGNVGDFVQAVFFATEHRKGGGSTQEGTHTLLPLARSSSMSKAFSKCFQKPGHLSWPYLTKWHLASFRLFLLLESTTCTVWYPKFWTWCCYISRERVLFPTADFLLQETTANLNRTGGSKNTWNEAQLAGGTAPSHLIHPCLFDIRYKNGGRRHGWRGTANSH